uniref:Ribonuclease A-domain domain-containing protein n=1 Tax=Pygocentrus nattereri TaxID=42514 RepID=A0AAR2IKY0_PYGNA
MKVVNKWTRQGEMHLSTLILLLVLFAALPTDGQNEATFIRKHIKLDMTPANCDKEMEEINKEMEKKNKNFKGCKKMNTFIKDTIENVRKVCTEGFGKNLETNFFQSNQAFTKVECVTTDTKKPCKYNGKEVKAPIHVACDQNNRPVHYGPPKRKG